MCTVLNGLMIVVALAAVIAVTPVLLKMIVKAYKEEEVADD